MKAFFGNNSWNSTETLTIIDKDRVFHGMIKQSLVDLQTIEF
jgi:hypothetical protein